MAGPNYRVGIVGCGVAGQAAATFLAETGHDVTLFERFTEARPLGAGLLLQPTGLAVLEALGLREQAMAQGARIVGLQARTAGGRAVLGLSYTDLHREAHGIGIHRSDLFDLLHGRLRRSSARLVTGAEIVEAGDRHLVDAAGTRHGRFDLVIVADGAHSKLRRRLMPQARAPLYPWGCLWATVPDTLGVSATGLLQQRVRGTTEMMGLLPVGRNELTIYWSVPADAPADPAAFRSAACALWPEAAAVVDHALQAGRLTHATYRHVALPRWDAGNILFIGDAAHGTSPQLGQGANLGLMDAWVLGQALGEASDLARALAVFAERRSSAVRFYRQACHLLTPFFQCHPWPLGTPLGWLRDGFMGWSCRLPMLRPMMTTTLAGLRQGWLGAARLDEHGRCPLPR